MDKIGTKTLEIRKQLVAAEQFIKETLKLFVPSAREKQIALSISTSKVVEGTRCLRPDDAIDVDVFKMRQVLRNVVSNGIKFTPAGGRVEVCVGVVCAKGHEALQITVTDSGSGMGNASKDKIFKEVFQYKPELLQGGGGSGLGLMISKEIIDAHRGTITMHSEGDGKGCTFKIQVPMSATPLLPDVTVCAPGQHGHANTAISADVSSNPTPEVLIERSQNEVHPLPQRPSDTLLKFLVVEDSHSCRKIMVNLQDHSRLLVLARFLSGKGDTVICEKTRA